MSPSHPLENAPIRAARWDANLKALVGFLEPEDVVLDVGGAACR